MDLHYRSRVVYCITKEPGQSRPLVEDGTHGRFTFRQNPPYSPMPHPRLPPEISDYIADLLYDKPRTLKRCCLVSKSWVPRARKHLFGRIKFRHPAEVDAWKKIFPDPANSPGYHTHSLSFRCAEVFTIADAEEGGWIQAFSNVVRLRVLNSGTRNFRSPSTALKSV